MAKCGKQGGWGPWIAALTKPCLLAHFLGEQTIPGSGAFPIDAVKSPINNAG